jgi:ABC-type lipoprotein release transport system permease subunit
MRRQYTLAWRNLWRNKKRTYITLASITFAVMISTFMRGLQLGSYEKMIDDSIRSSTGHLAVMDKYYWDDKTLINSMELSEELTDTLNTSEAIDFWAPEIVSGCLASSGNHTRGVLVMGVDPVIKDKQLKLQEKIIEGSYLTAQDQAVEIGKELALFLRIGVGDTLILFGQGYMGVTAAAKYPVKGIFDHPMSDFNKRLVFLPLSEAQHLFFMEGRVSTVNVVLNDKRNLQVVQPMLYQALDTSLLEIKQWKVMNEEILSAIESDNFFGVIMIAVLYMVIGFGIYGTILMMTMERKKEFSIMIAIGMKRLNLIRQVVIESFFIAVLGATAGLLLSFPLIFFYAANPIEITGENMEVYQEMNIEPVLAISTEAGYMLSQFAIVLALSFVASLLPLRSIVKFEIVDIIRGRQ